MQRKFGKYGYDFMIYPITVWYVVLYPIYTFYKNINFYLEWY